MVVWFEPQAAICSAKGGRRRSYGAPALSSSSDKLRQREDREWARSSVG